MMTTGTLVLGPWVGSNGLVPIMVKVKFWPLKLKLPVQLGMEMVCCAVAALARNSVMIVKNAHLKGSNRGMGPPVAKPFRKVSELASIAGYGSQDARMDCLIRIRMGKCLRIESYIGNRNKIAV